MVEFYVISTKSQTQIVDSSGTVIDDFSGSQLLQPNASQTPEVFEGTSTNGDTTLKTCGAAEKFYVTDVCVSWNGAGAGGSVYLKIAGSQVTHAIRITNAVPYNFQQIFGTPLEVGNSEALVITGNGVNLDYTVTGFSVS